MLKIELNSYNSSALRHLGAALVQMGQEMELERSTTPVEKQCGCADRRVGFVPEMVAAYGKDCEPAPDTLLGMSVKVDPTVEPGAVTLVSPTPPVTIVGNMETLTPTVTVPAPPTIEPPTTGATPPAPPVDDDAAWPDPPGTAPADNLDADGIPWDARIHAGTKTRLKADNTWKLKPGIDKALVDQVKAELKGVQAVVAPSPPAPTLSDAAAVSAALQAPPAPTGPTTFAELIKEVTTRITAGQMTPDQVNGAVSLVTGGQLTMCNQLAARQDLIPAVWGALCPTVA